MSDGYNGVKNLQQHPFGCKKCGGSDFNVIETRKTQRYVRRTRECTQCGERINTAEMESSYIKRIERIVKLIEGKR